ncbi:Hch1 protein [Saccharomycopsis crataegensis]|uniref:Hch1 protein n=1 Tax=Saccharomycopsis crataegensis TaxID=43959 RepID=A0AAV5QE02_9ASCO|nr:Hch1 protein [Saccharomycopsis crataegensis]
MVVNNPNNWHWVDKNVLPWSKTYITEKLTAITTTSSDFSVVIPTVTSVTGDSDLSQRKGKAIVIYDMKIVFDVEATKDQQEDAGFKSSIEIPEFIHDMDEDDYQFDIKNKDLSIEQKTILRKQVFPKVVELLMKYQDDVIGIHGKDLQHQS